MVITWRCYVAPTSGLASVLHAAWLPCSAVYCLDNSTFIVFIKFLILLTFSLRAMKIIVKNLKQKTAAKNAASPTTKEYITFRGRN